MTEIRCKAWVAVRCSRATDFGAMWFEADGKHVAEMHIATSYNRYCKAESQLVEYLKHLWSASNTCEILLLFYCCAAWQGTSMIVEKEQIDSDRV